jgi:CheY-like chemotaxis protein
MGLEQVKPAVLVADDNAMNLAAFASVLDVDYSVTCAADGPQALALAAARDFSVIVLDVRMPGLDGFQTAVELRKLARARTTPIIFLSAHEQTSVPQECGYVAGATDFLFGMTDGAMLRFKVASYASQHRRDFAMKLQLRQLRELVATLQGEVSSRSEPDEALATKVRELECLVDEFERQADSRGLPIAAPMASVQGLAARPPS